MKNICVNASEKNVWNLHKDKLGSQRDEESSSRLNCTKTLFRSKIKILTMAYTNEKQRFWGEKQSFRRHLICKKFCNIHHKH